MNSMNFPTTKEELVAWRRELDLSQRQAIRLLRIGRRTLQEYESGKNSIPWTVSLACGMVSVDIDAVRQAVDTMTDPVEEYEDLFDI